MEAEINRINGKNIPLFLERITQRSHISCFLQSPRIQTAIFYSCYIMRKNVSGWFRSPVCYERMPECLFVSLAQRLHTVCVWIITDIKPVQSFSFCLMIEDCSWWVKNGNPGQSRQLSYSNIRRDLKALFFFCLWVEQITLVYMYLYMVVCVDAYHPLCLSLCSAVQQGRDYILHNGEIINIFTWLLVCSFKKPN